MATIKSNQKISACLWFDKNAGQAVKFYTGIFKNSKVLRTSYYTESSRMPAGTVLTIEFQIEGQKLVALNGGPYFNFTEAVSLIVSCKNQKEVDYYWEKLSKGGAKVQCGWLKDKFGLSWQIVPEIVYEMMIDKDSKKSSSVMDAILKMKKLDIKKLEKAYKGK